MLNNFKSKEIKAIAASLALITFGALAPQTSRASKTCHTRKPFQAAISGNGRYISNMCTETGSEAACLAARAANQDFKNGGAEKKLWNGYQLEIDANTMEHLPGSSAPSHRTLFGHKEGPELAWEIGEYFDTGGADVENGETPHPDGKIDGNDCGPFRIALVGHSNGGWVAASVAAVLKKGVTGKSSSSRTKVVKDFDGLVQIRLGLLDPVGLSDDDYVHALPIMDRIADENPYMLPTTGCVYHIQQQNGCPDKYCKLNLANTVPIPSGVTGFLIRGIEYAKGPEGATSSSVDFTKNMTGVNVQTKIDSANAQTQLAHHLNMEQISTQIAEYVYSPPSSTNYLNCGNPSFLTKNDVKDTTPNPLNGVQNVIDGINDETGLAALKATFDSDNTIATAQLNRTFAAMTQFRSFAIAARNAMDAHPSASTDTDSIGNALVAWVTSFQAAGQYLVNATDVETGVLAGAVEDPVSVTFVPKTEFSTYLSPIDRGHDFTEHNRYALTQMASAYDPVSSSLVNYTTRRFYQTGVESVYANNIKLLLDTGTIDTDETWEPSLSIYIPPTFTGVSAGGDTVYPWSVDEVAFPYGEHLVAEGLPLDYSHGEVRITLSGENVEILQKDGAGTWNTFLEKAPLTGFATSIVKNQTQLTNFFANIGFKVLNAAEGSTVTVGFEVISDNDAAHQITRTVSFFPPVSGVLDGGVGTQVDPDFKAIFAERLLGL